MRLHEEVAALKEDCIQIRRELHRIPETAFEEFKTQNYILKHLAPLKPDSLITIAGTGVKAVFHANPEAVLKNRKSPGDRIQTVAFRSDIDALNRGELNEVPYASTHPGKMHACGHDGHMTVLLLFARLIAKHRDRLYKNIVLIFQPGEEGAAGASVMVKEGVLKDPDVDRIYGLHLWPTVDKGKIGIRWGPMMAQTSEFDIAVHGKSAHGASPQMGIDAVVVAAELITMLQTAITRNIDPHQDALLTIGKIEGGSARNIIADEVKLYGTFRVFSGLTYARLFSRIRAMVDGLQMATGAHIEIKELLHYPCVDNRRELVEDFYTYLDDMSDVALVEPVMAGEDFAFYQQEVPGLFMFIGIKGGKNEQPLHNCRFDFDEEELLPGIEIFWRLSGLSIPF